MKIKLMPTGIRGQSGFSLVELMVVVAIIGVLAALAVPRFQKFQAKAKQGEAKSNLSHIYTLQQSYYGDNDQFAAMPTCFAGACVNNALGFSVDGHTRYNYGSTGGLTFTATATENTPGAIMAGDAAIGKDTWTIDQNKCLRVTTDVVTSTPTPAGKCM